ncbi:hypothetical protein GH714_004589 [Hevea brasiliensis]|uniref:Uncharacterized protein n=1 Tax=Hevea brasiliensis TaxID=3981 RepID=A0A6A6LMT6_HEVBR|nr:hypothetical protein GH714_004589 [Hevea brasiliensis]
MFDEGEVPPPVPRGLTLDQAHMLRLERQQNAMQDQIAQITQALARLVALQPQRECNGPMQQGRGDDDDDKEPRVEEVPPMVAKLLEEFGNVFPEEMLEGLPPFHAIEHRIDFIPGATLPNRPAYRSNPEEANELHK